MKTPGVPAPRRKTEKLKKNLRARPDLPEATKIFDNFCDKTQTVSKNDNFFNFYGKKSSFALFCCWGKQIQQDTVTIDLFLSSGVRRRREKNNDGLRSARARRARG